MVLNVSANWITLVRFALNFNRKLKTLVDFTNSTAERNGLYNYYGYYATITSLLRVYCTLFYASLYPLECRPILVHWYNLSVSSLNKP